MMRIVWLVLLMALIGGCGSGGGTAGNADPGQDPEQKPGPVPSIAKVDIGTRAATAATVVYGVQFVLHLPAGVTVQADTDGKVPATVLTTAGAGASSGARYVPATGDAKASVRVNVVDAGGFVVGGLATLTCNVSPGVTVDAAGFSLDEFVAKDANGASMTGITPHFTVQTQ